MRGGERGGYAAFAALLRNALAYSGTNVVAQVALFAQGIVLRRLLAPELMGIWHVVQVVKGYVQMLSLGTLNGASRELPILRGQGEAQEEERSRAVTLMGSIGEGLLLAMGVLGYAAWGREGYAPLELLALGVTALLVVTGRLYEAYLVLCQGAEAYVPLSRSLLLGSVVSAVAMPVGAWLAGVPGLLIAAAAAEVARVGLLAVFAGQAGVGVRPRWDPSVYRRLTSIGFVYRMADYPHSFFLGLDLLWAAKGMDLRGLGLYALARTFYSQSSDITGRITTVFSTRVLGLYGEGCSRAQIGEETRRFVQLQLLVFVPLVCWVVASAAPFVVRQLMPLYTESIPVMLLLLVGCFFLGQNNSLYVMWVAEKRLVAYAVSNVVGVAAVAGSLAISWWGVGREALLGFAAAVVFGLFLYFAYLVSTAGRELWGRGAAWWVFVQVTLAATWVGLVLWTAADPRTGAGDWQEDLTRSGLSSLRMLVGVTPVVIAGLWLSRVGRLVVRAVREFLGLRHA